jgi:hypothetical protein
MRILRTVLRWFFAIEASAIFVGLLGLARLDYAVHLTHRYRASSVMLLILAVIFTLSLGVLAASTAWRMKRADRWTRRAGLAASVMNLAVFPVGTVMAIAGIFCFTRKLNDAELAAPQHQPVPGDGTGKHARIILFGAQMVCIWAAGGFLLPWAAGRWMHGNHMAWPATLGTIALAIYGSVLIHELGHFTLGRAVGFCAVGFRVGCFELRVRGGRWRFRFSAAGFLSGHTAMVPRYDGRLRERGMMMIAGGPLASAALALTGGAVLLTLPNLPYGIGGGLLLLSIFAAFDFLFNLLPMASGVNYSDGARLWQLWRGGPWAEYLCSIHYIGLSRTTPMRPGEWPREMVERMAAFAEQLPDPAGVLVCVSQHYEDAGDLERAAHFLAQACERMRPKTELASDIARERAYFAAFYRSDASEGARWLAEAPPDLSLAAHWRARTAVLLASKELQAAEEAWRKGGEIVAKLRQTGLYDPERRHFRELGLALSRIPQPTEKSTAALKTRSGAQEPVPAPGLPQSLPQGLP